MAADPRELTNDELLKTAHELVVTGRTPGAHVSRRLLVETLAEISSRYKRLDREANEMWHALNPEGMGR